MRISNNPNITKTQYKNHTEFSGPRGNTLHVGSADITVDGQTNNYTGFAIDRGSDGNFDTIVGVNTDSLGTKPQGTVYTGTAPVLVEGESQGEMSGGVLVDDQDTIQVLMATNTQNMEAAQAGKANRGVWASYI